MANNINNYSYDSLTKLVSKFTLPPLSEKKQAWSDETTTPITQIKNTVLPPLALNTYKPIYLPNRNNQWTGQTPQAPSEPRPAFRRPLTFTPKPPSEPKANETQANPPVRTFKVLSDQNVAAPFTPKPPTSPRPTLLNRNLLKIVENQNAPFQIADQIINNTGTRQPRKPSSRATTQFISSIE